MEQEERDQRGKTGENKQLLLTLPWARWSQGCSHLCRWSSSPAPPPLSIEVQMQSNTAGCKASWADYLVRISLTNISWWQRCNREFATPKISGSELELWLNFFPIFTAAARRAAVIIMSRSLFVCLVTSIFVYSTKLICLIRFRGSSGAAQGSSELPGKFFFHHQYCARDSVSFTKKTGFA